MENATPASNEFQAPNILFISIPPSERIFQAQNCTSCHEGASLQGLGESSHPHGFSLNLVFNHPGCDQSQI